MMEERSLTCPWCWEEITILLDPEMETSWIEDCEVCCRPILFRIGRSGVRIVDFSWERAQ